MSRRCCSLASGGMTCFEKPYQPRAISLPSSAIPRVTPTMSLSNSSRDIAARRFASPIVSSLHGGLTVGLRHARSEAVDVDDGGRELRHLGRREWDIFDKLDQAALVQVLRAAGAGQPHLAVHFEHREA